MKPTKTNPLIEHGVDPNRIRLLRNHVSVFFGVMGNDNQTFFPFFCTLPEDNVTFEPEAVLQYDEEYDYLYLDKGTVSEIRADYAEHKASGSNKIANESIFEAVMAHMDAKAGDRA